MINNLKFTFYQSQLGSFTAFKTVLVLFEIEGGGGGGFSQKGVK